MAKKPRGILMLLGLLLLIGGGFLGIFYHNTEDITQKTEHRAQKTEDRIYYCPMHPNYTSNKPGECPICGMDLVLKKEDRTQKTEHRKAGEIFISTKKQQRVK